MILLYTTTFLEMCGCSIIHSLQRKIRTCTRAFWSNGLAQMISQKSECFTPC